MMGQAMRDPLFLACMAIAEQDAPRWATSACDATRRAAGRRAAAIDTSGGMLTAKDRQGVQCDFCHRAVDRDYVPGVSSAAATRPSLAAIDPPLLDYANGQFITGSRPDPQGPPIGCASQPRLPGVSLPPRARTLRHLPRREQSGLRPGATAVQSTAQHLRRGTPRHGPCATCIPWSAPISEWTQSEYATTGVYAPAVRRQQGRRHRLHLPGLPHARCDAVGPRSSWRRPRPTCAARPDRRQHLRPGHPAPTSIPAEVDQAQLRRASCGPAPCSSWRRRMEVTPADHYGDHGEGDQRDRPQAALGLSRRPAHLAATSRPIDGSARWSTSRAPTTAATGELDHDDDVKIYEVKPGSQPGPGRRAGLARPARRSTSC